MSQTSCSKNILLHLSLIEGIGPATIQKISSFIERIGGDWSLMYTFNGQDLHRQCQLHANVAQKVVTGLADIQLLEQELALIEKNNVTLITMQDDHYSALLKHIYLPPPILYLHGNRALLQQKSIAVIGSREANRYAQKVVDTVVPELVAYGYTIVSGGAIGADSMAHYATLQSQGETIVVLGSGLLEPYPVRNKKLFETIVAQNGAILSPFPLGMRANEGTFPARNRIIAGLSQAVLVIQAAVKSGARITAQFALDQGREVAVIPGDIFDPLSAGCHQLARQGAAIVSSTADILELLGVTVEQQVQLSTIPAALTHDDPIVQACNLPQSFDQLLIATQLSPSELQERLFNLTLEGHIEQNAAGLWVIC